MVKMYSLYIHAALKKKATHHLSVRLLQAKMLKFSVNTDVLVLTHLAPLNLLAVLLKIIPMKLIKKVRSIFTTV